MGLDSIELLMEIENYFDIRIPDVEAEKITTIQLMVNSVASHLNITDESLELQNKIFQKVIPCIQILGSAKEKIELTHLASKYLPANNKNIWKDLESCLGLSVPEIEIARNADSKIGDKLKKIISWTPMYEWHEITIERFVDAICANNYRELIDRKNIKTKYEIYIAVVGITVDKIGVDYYEILPDKSFTSDLGVD